MHIKICGLNPIRDVQICIDLKVDFLGFVFYKKSPRNINLTEVKNLLKYNKQKSSFVAVTVDPTDDFINKTILNNFDYIQLHGNETNERVKEIKYMGLKVIKVIFLIGLIVKIIMDQGNNNSNLFSDSDYFSDDSCIINNLSHLCLR